MIRTWFSKNALFLVTISFGLLIGQAFDMHRTLPIFALFWTLFWGTFFVLIKFVPVDKREEPNNLH